MIRKACFPLGTAVCLALAQTAWSQRASGWRVYRISDGLPESACSSVTIGLNGRILVTHPRAKQISELDGYGIRTFPWTGPPDSRASESPAGQLWVLSSDGLSEWKDNAWFLHPEAEITAAFRSGFQVAFLPVQQGRVLLLLPGRLAEFDAADPGRMRGSSLRTENQTHIGAFTGMVSPGDDRLWISGTAGLARTPRPARSLKRDDIWQEFIPPASLEITNLRAPKTDGEAGVTCVAESISSGRKVAVHFDGQRWTVFPAGEHDVRDAWKWPNDTMGAISADALVQWRGGRAVEADEISARQYSDAAVEQSGAVWLATSEGLLRYAPLTWKIPAFAAEQTSPIYDIVTDSASRLWFLSNGRLHSVVNDSHREFPLPETAERTPRTASLFPLKDRTLLLMLGGELFQFHPDSSQFQRLQLAGAGQLGVLGALKGGSLCVQGLASGSQSSILVTYDGGRFQPFPYPAPDHAIGGEFLALFAAQNGDVWLSGERGVASWHDRKWQSFVSTDGMAPEGATCFAELADGKIWSGTQDKVWEFDGRNWTIVRANFDHINALFRTRDGSIWVASNSGLRRFWQNAWIENNVDEGLPSPSIRAICEDPDGRLCAATAHGLGVYYPEADPDPPKTQIRVLTGENPKLVEPATVNLIFEGQDKWKYTSRDHLIYSYRLDQKEWSSFQDLNAVSFPDLPAGKHFCQVRALDRAGNIEPNPAQFEFSVALPWFKETRLISISIAALAITVFFAGVALNRHRRLLRSYAEVERKVAERTRELERANRELLHSQKMNALGTLAAGVAHDFNSILSIIKGSAQIIEDNLDNPQKVMTRLDRIKTVIEQGAGIVRAMLGFSRTSDERLSLCNINEVVNDTIKLLGDRFLRDVEVDFEPGPDLPMVPAVPDFVQQALLNFIFNAAESMTERKRVMLATRRIRGLPAGAVLMPATAAEYVSIAVRDSGCGISPENMPRIFEPFFTTKALSSRRGTGLGLSMVYELAKKMEAGLAVESVVNQGSTFILILPVRELAPAPPPTAAAAHASHTP